MKGSKRLITLLLAVCMLFSMVPMTASAAGIENFTDFPTWWSREAMTAAYNNGLLSGVSETEIKPKANLTRAEAATIIVRAFGATTQADISAFGDVAPGAWYYNAIASAVKMGAMNGKGESTMEPDAAITREEIFSILARVLCLSNDNTQSLQRFPDAGDVSAWAAPYLAALTDRGYISGGDGGCLFPKANITREEFAQFMFNMIKTYITASGTYNGSYEGIVVVRAGGVTFEGASFSSDLVIGDGAGSGNIYLTNVSIGKRLLTRGGTMTLKTTTVGDKVVVNNVNGVTNFNNYNTEAVFANIDARTEAKFLGSGGGGGAIGGSGGGGGGGTVTPMQNVTVTFVVNGSSTSVTVTSGSQLQYITGKPSVTPATGKKFDGWYTSAGLKVQDSDAITADMTLTAKFSNIQYTVEYWKEDGSGKLSEQTYDLEHLTMAPPTVTPKEGYTLRWVKEDGTVVTQLTIDSSTSATAPLKLFVQWVKNQEGWITITFNSEGSNVASLPMLQGKTLAEGLGSNMPNNPSKDYYDFKGWLKPDNTPVTETDTFSADTTLTAKFEPHAYTIIYDLNYDNQTITETYTVENAILKAAPTRTGYNFKGWWTAATGGTQLENLAAYQQTPQDNLTLYARWEKKESNKITVTFKVNGNTHATMQVTPKGTLGTLPSEPTPADYYTFAGWYTGENGGGTKITAETQITLSMATNKSLTLYAYFKPIEYNITYVKNNGEAYGSGTYTVTSTDALAAAPTRDDYDFAGWWTTADDTGRMVSSYTELLNALNGVPQTTTLYAHWSEKAPDKITIMFTVLGSQIYAENILPGNKATSWPADPVRAGYTFNGWKLNGTPVAANYEFSEAATVVADMTKKTYTVEFYKKDGTTLEKSETYTVDNVPKTLSNEEYNSSALGYDFSHWADGNGTQVTQLTIDAATPDTLKLYAQFTIHTYKYTYYDRSGNLLSYEREYTIESSNTHPEGLAADPGYEFLGWYTTPQPTSGGTAPAAYGQTSGAPGSTAGTGTAPGGTKGDFSVTATTPDIQPLYAWYGAIVYEVHWYSAEGVSYDNGDCDGTWTVENADEFAVPTVDAASAPTGYYFAGWYTGLNGTGSKVTENLGSFISEPYGNLKFYAYWKEIPPTKYAVYFSEGGFAAQEVVKDGKLSSLPEYNKLGYTFEGWYTQENGGGTKVTTDTPITESMVTNNAITLYPKLTLKTFTVKFYDGETELTDRELSYNVLNADEKTLPTLSKDDHTFDGWYTETGSKVESLSVTAATPEVLKLYAKWTAVTPEQATVTFKAEGHSDIVKVVTKGEAVGTAWPNDPTPAPGYKFNGWFTAETGGAEVTSETVINSSMTVYAQFSEKTYTVRFFNGENELTGFKKSYTITSVPDMPSLDDTLGNIFSGWYTEADGGVLVTDLRIKADTAQERILYARWNVQNVRVTFYEGYYPGESDYEIDSLELQAGASLKAVGGEVPEIESWLLKRTGYKKGPSVSASLYPTETIHTVSPAYWYVNDEGDLTAFDDEVAILKDTNVYLLTKELSVALTLQGTALPSLFAMYEPDKTRAADTAKDMMTSGSNVLETALSSGLVPQYDTAKEALMDKLAKSKVIDADGNIKLFTVPIAISRLMQQETVEGVVKSYVESVVNDAEQLKSILEMIDIDTLIAEIGNDELIGMLTDEQIVAELKKESNRETITKFIIDDLKSETPKMETAVVNFIKTNEAFRNEQTDKILADLKDSEAPLKDASGSLTTKGQVIDYIVGQLQTDDSDLQKMFVDEIMESLTSGNDTYGIINELKTGTLKANLVDMVVTELKAGNNVFGLFDNDDLREKIVDQLLTDLETNGKDADSTVLNYIKTELETKDSQMQQLFIDELKKELENPDSDVTAKVVDYFKTELGKEENSDLRTKVADKLKDELAAENSEYREELMKPAYLDRLFANEGLKSTLIDALAEETMLTQILSDEPIRKQIVEKLLANDDFVDTLIARDEFKGYLIEAVQTGGSLYNDVSGLLNSNETFKTAILDKAKSDDGFKALLGEEGALRTEVESGIERSNYATDEALLAYVFAQEGAEDYSSLISEETINEKIGAAVEDSALESAWADATDEQKKSYKRQIYADEEGNYTEIKNAVITAVETEANTQFATLRKQTLDSLANGVLPDDPTLAEIVDTELLNYFTKYLNKELTNNDVNAAIGNILVGYVRDLHATPPTDTDLQELINSAEKSFKNQVTTSIDGDELINLVGSYRGEHLAEIKAAISDNYSPITNYVKGNIETATINDSITGWLKTNAGSIDNSVILEIVDQMLNSTDDEDAETIKGLLRKYIDGLGDDDTTVDDAIKNVISGLSAEDIGENLKTFLTSATGTTETMVKDQITAYIDGLGSDDLKDRIVTYVTNNEAYARTIIETEIGKLSNDQIAQFVADNEEDVRDLVLPNVKNRDAAAIAEDLRKVLANDTAGESETLIREQITAFLGNTANDDTIISLVKSYISNPANENELKTYISKFIESESLNVQFVTDNRDLINDALSAMDLSGYIDTDAIVDYVGNLSAENKAAFAKTVYSKLSAMTYYTDFINSLFNKESFEINSNNLPFVQGVNEAIGKLDYDTMMSQLGNSQLETLIDNAEKIFGEGFIKKYFDQAKTDYYEGLKAEIDKVKADSTVTTSYTTSLSITVNIVKDIMRPLYDKATEVTADKLAGQTALKYSENQYFKYLVEDRDLLTEMLSGSDAAATDELTGYKLKGELDYYNFLLNTLIIADDAMCWYGDEANMPEGALDSLINAIVDKPFYAKNKLDGILADYQATGNLPSQLETLINSVSQLNSLLTQYQSQIDSLLSKYLGSNLNQKFESTQITENDKFQTAIDIMIGADDPTFTIDTIYDIFYRFDAKMQQQLKQLVDSGKLDKALDKFEQTSFGQILGSSGARGDIADKLDEIKATGKVTSAFNSIGDVIRVIAEHGSVAPFRVDEDKVTVEDAYQFNLRNAVTVKLTRQFE